DRLLGLAVERICHVALPNEAAIAPLPLHLGSGMALLRGSVTIAGREHFVVHETHLHDVDMLRITADLSADNNQTEPGDGVEPPTALAEAATGKVRRERERYVLAKAGTDIALRLSDIAAMREPPAGHEITPCPNTTPGLEGIVFLDGRVTPLIRLSAYLGMTASEDTGRARVLVIDKDTLRIGLLVEDIEGIATSTWFAHQDAAVSGGFDLVAVRVAGQIAVRNCLDLPALAGRLATDWDHAATPELLPSLAASDTAERQA
ncbi:MAG: chemotaxis protein CheW, partial [Pseudomonadota bacterium]